MKLITSSSPHIRSGETTRRLMGTVLLALLPTLAALAAAAAAVKLTGTNR